MDAVARAGEWPVGTQLAETGGCNPRDIDVLPAGFGGCLRVRLPLKAAPVSLYLSPLAKSGVRRTQAHADGSQWGPLLEMR